MTDPATATLYVCPTIGCECEGQGLPADEGAGLFCSLCLRDLVPMTVAAGEYDLGDRLGRVRVDPIRRLDP